MAICKTLNVDGTSIRIGTVRFSYARVFQKNEDGYYSISVLVPKNNEAAVKLINDAVKVAAKNGAEKFWKGKIPQNLHKPLRDGDDERSDDENYAGMYFFNAKTKNAPKVVYDDGGMAVEATEEDFYSGCYGAVTLQFYAYDNNGNRGVAAGLGNIIKTEDGERLGGGRSLSVDESFGDMLD